MCGLAPHCCNLTSVPTEMLSEHNRLSSFTHQMQWNSLSLRPLAWTRNALNHPLHLETLSSLDFEAASAGSHLKSDHPFPLDFWTGAVAPCPVLGPQPMPGEHFHHLGPVLTLLSTSPTFKTVGGWKSRSQLVQTWSERVGWDAEKAGRREIVESLPGQRGSAKVTEEGRIQSKQCSHISLAGWRRRVLTTEEEAEEATEPSLRRWGQERAWQQKARSHQPTPLTRRHVPPASPCCCYQRHPYAVPAEQARQGGRKRNPAFFKKNFTESEISYLSGTQQEQSLRASSKVRPETAEQMKKGSDTTWPSLRTISSRNRADDLCLWATLQLAKSEQHSTQAA